MRRLFALFVVLVIAGVLGGTAAAIGNGKHFIAHLSGDNEVPPVDTGGAGVAKVTLDESGDALHFMLNVSNLNTAATQAHIHCGPVGQNGSIATFLLHFVAAGVDAHGRTAAGTITNADIIPTADSTLCPGGISDLDDLVEQIAAGNAYVNVHTLTSPAGEVRAQLG
jgi:hypothetical protein